MFNAFLGGLLVAAFWFLAAQLVLQAQSMQGVVGSVSIPAWILILTVPVVIIGVFGYRWIHRVMQVSSVVVGVSMVIIFIQGLMYRPLPPGRRR